ncbi:ground-like domain protein [Dictyocaulus viviparus]|uniref:Ground-like domain protein n=1 Tax=Dictyocaulus viviparus TaxID=29172 RepID=A0A0D8Y0P8_DICVI|nr:ground-like domain protein [Dictyocaulus viviparus]
MIVLLLLLGLTTQIDSQCYSRGCLNGYNNGVGVGVRGYEGGHYAQAIPQPIPQQIPQIPQSQPVDYIYKINGYAQAPIEVNPSAERDIAAVPIPNKSTEYDEIDKKLSEIKPSSIEETANGIEEPIVKPPASSTYIREMPYHPYAQRPMPMPYRPNPVLQTPSYGCNMMQPPQYYQPAPFMPRGYVMPYSQPASGMIQPPRYHQAPLNDCCGRCSAICGRHARRNYAKSAKTVSLNGSNITTSMNETYLSDTRCTSKKLKDIMSKISHRTPSLAKRLIQRLAEKNIGGLFSVFCSKDDFTYVSRGEVYCQTENNGVLCYAFQHN